MLQITINVVLQKIIPPHNIITLYAAYKPIIIVCYMFYLYVTI